MPMLPDGTHKGHFDFVAGSMRGLTADMRLSLDDAVQFGSLYGVCCQCGRTLRAHDSIQAGIGPICAGKL